MKTERGAKNRQRIPGELSKPKPANTELAARGRLPLEAG